MKRIACEQGRKEVRKPAAHRIVIIFLMEEAVKRSPLERFVQRKHDFQWGYFYFRFRTEEEKFLFSNIF